jgi:hypothetical protein
MPLTLCRKRFDGIYHIFGLIATIGFTLVLKSIQKEVESRGSIENGSGLGVFLPGRPGRNRVVLGRTGNLGGT